MKPEPLTLRAKLIHRQAARLRSHLKPLDAWERDATPEQRDWAIQVYGSMAAAHEAFRKSIERMANTTNEQAEMEMLEGDEF